MTVDTSRSLAQLKYQKRSGFPDLPKEKAPTIRHIRKDLREPCLYHAIPTGFLQPFVVKKMVVMPGTIFPG